LDEFSPIGRLFTFGVFVEQSSTKECSHQPSPPPQKKWKQIQTCKSVRTYQSMRRARNLTVFDNFIIFKLCSTTEQMPALVYHYKSFQNIQLHFSYDESDLSFSKKGLGHILGQFFTNSWITLESITAAPALRFTAKDMHYLLICNNVLMCFHQGCQMAYFHTKNPNLDKFWRDL
jgi:hypothetical protein